MKIKPSCTYKGLFKAENPWRVLNSFLHQGIRNQSRPSVSVTNHHCSDSCCFDNGLWNSGPNPRRHLVCLCLCLLPSWGAAIHRCQVGRSFSQGDQCKTTSLCPNSRRGRNWVPEVVEGCGRWKFRVDLEGRKGFIGMYCKTQFPSIFISRGETGSHTVHLALIELAD